MDRGAWRATAHRVAKDRTGLKQLSMNTQKRLTDLRERTYGGGGKGYLGSLDMYTLLYLKWITNKNLLYTTWNSAQYYVAAWMGGEFEGEWIHVHVWMSLSAVHLKLLQHCQLSILQYKELKKNQLFPTENEDDWLYCIKLPKLGLQINL